MSGNLKVHSSSPAEQSSFRTEVTKYLFVSNRGALVASSALAILLVVALWGTSPPSLLLGWLILVELVYMARMMLARAYRQAAPSNAAFWLKRFRLGVVVSGLVWGGASVLLFPAHNVTAQSALLFTIIGLAAGSAISYAIDSIVLLGFMFPLLLPLVVRLLAEGTHYTIAMGIMLVLFLGYVSMSLRHSYKAMHENIRLHLQAVKHKELIRGQKEFLNTIFESAPVCIKVIAPDGKLLQMNQIGFAMLEVDSLEEAQQIGLPKFVLPDFRDAFMALHKSVCAGNSGKLELPVKGKKGTLRWLETYASPFRDANGSIAGLIGLSRDITDLKRIEDDLQNSSQRLALHFQQTPLAVIEWGTDFRVVDWNPAAESVFGYTKAEALGRSAKELILPESAKEHVDKIWHALLTGQGGLHSANENITKDGKAIFCEWYNTPLIDDSGQVIGVASLAQDVSEQKKAKERLHFLAYFDDLTRLPNHALFTDRLAQAIVDAHRHKRLVGVMLMDLDNFKFVNDALGHEAGNLLLQAVASRLGSCFREGDTVARFGDDEFSVILTDMSNAEDVGQVAQKILETFKTPFTVSGSELFITFSIGITMYPFDSDDIQSLIRNADSALHQAKKLGRNNFQFYSTEMTARVEKRMALETGLRYALERGQFLLHYQPQVDLKTGKIVAMEALIRWQHPESGMISPLEFIPIAEETGLIIPIGEWVLRTACAQTKAWQDQGLTDMVIAVNLSARQFSHGMLVQEVMAALEETGLEPRYLELEITESLLLDGADSVISSTLEALKKLGITLAIDDFGTGYSSLSYLKRFPIDKLKIDQSFVRGVTSDPDDASLVVAIIAIARSLRLTVIAEGVETEGHLNYLRHHNCDHMQGYYFSRPLPAPEFAALVNSGKTLPPAK